MKQYKHRLVIESNDMSTLRFLFDMWNNSPAEGCADLGDINE